jgi:xanthine dehydrogenase large subunit
MNDNITFHESAKAHVQGLATYIDDIAEIKGTYFAAPIVSGKAHGKLLGIDSSQAINMPGVIGILTHKDIPGDPILASFAQDEPVFAIDKVEFLGQVVGIVVAKSVKEARVAARAVKLNIQELPALLDPRSAHEAKSYVLPKVTVKRGEAEGAIREAKNRLQGCFEVGGQEHFYLEGQIAYVLPLEQNEWLVYSSTQHPGEVQHWVAHALGIENHAVTVQCRRMGGGFGGKETQAGHIAVWAAIGAKKFNAPVKFRVDRDDDFMITGKRHPFAYDYEVGFDDDGVLHGLKLNLFTNCGFSADLSGPVADRAVFHSDNAYYLEDVEIHSYRCKTHTQSHTAYRGFGGPQGVIAIERILGDIALHLGIDPLLVRKRNFYGIEERNTTHYLMQVEDNIIAPLVNKLEIDSQYQKRRQAIAVWNQNSPIIKRGIAITPVKFGISFTATWFNQAGALVHAYLDGSVLVSHGGTEMGQGLHTKVVQIVAKELGLPVHQVRISSSDTSKVANASATAASSGTDMNGRAAEYAARDIRKNISEVIAKTDNCSVNSVSFKDGKVITPKTTRTFKEAVNIAYYQRVQLWSDGFYSTPKVNYDKETLTGRPFYYFAYGAACTEVAIDTLTGENRVLAVDILHDVGTPINREIDIGQIEGGFVQGLGWLSTEELVWDDKGRLRTHAPSTYKIPTSGDIPQHFKTALWPEPNREDNVGGSKAVGEPPFMLAISFFEAIRDAIAQARGVKKPIQIDAPATAERVLMALHVKEEKEQPEQQ